MKLKMSTSWLALVVVAVVASGAASKSYCDISANHQLCGKQGLSSTCVGASNLKYDVTEAERDVILEAVSWLNILIHSALMLSKIFNVEKSFVCAILYR